MIESDYPPVPLTSEPFHETLLRAIKRHYETGKNKIAFIDGEKPQSGVTFRMVYDQAYSISAFLHAKGFGKDVACAVIPNLWQYAPFFLGVSLRGGAISGASALFTDCEYFIRSKF
ncbi:unnamed protein product [Strongylus vulgaris]|uniref:AMP-dependent synthetase/ligase domain-containing protein n=1 Tax=Strongylus vulgaris TaxID=40348 RepID=A0A3P7J623_STRVU|nr:unnamed protein product [Strongylus vulgaris]